MIIEVELSYFKKFDKETIGIGDNVVLVGPNNSGKTTLLQAIVVWNLALRKWLAERGPESGSKASKRTGIPITRKDFTAIPLREMRLLWTDCSTALKQKELGEGQHPGRPRILRIGIRGKKAASPWSLAFELTYGGSEQIYVKPSNSTPITKEVNEILKDLEIVHVPPFSGIGADEARLDKAYQDVLVGQGRPGEILRNLLLELHRDKLEEWANLKKDIEDIFGYELLPPKYEGRPYILCEYQSGIPSKSRHLPTFDIASAGSGFLQVLLLLGFFYARPAAVLLLDEPDAHLHIILQKQIYDRLRLVARERHCQLFIATHSEVLVDGTDPQLILSFFRKPHVLLSDVARDQIREALKLVTSLDILLADETRRILYLENETDFNLLREWAHILNHKICKFFDNPFWRANKGHNVKEAREHFFALKAIKQDISGVLLLDGDNRNFPDHDLTTEGLTVLRWVRYEAESYLLHPEALRRFINGEKPDMFAIDAMDFLQDQLPPAVFKNPLDNHDYLNSTPASKTLLPQFFVKAGVPLTKNEYYQIAAQMRPDEIPPEVTEKLDAICSVFKQATKPII